MILVTAAYGNQGRAIIPRLKAAGQTVRAVRSTPGHERELIALGASEVLVGSTADRAFIRQAMEGVDTVVHIGPSAHPLEREMGIAAIDAAADAGVKHFVFSSCLHSQLSKMIQHKCKRDVEEHLIESGLNFTILKPPLFMIPAWIPPAAKEGVFRIFWDLDVKHVFIDLQDLGEVAAKVVLEREQHYGATYEVTSKSAPSGNEIAKILSVMTGRHVEAQFIAPKDFSAIFHNTPRSKASKKYELEVLEAIGLWNSTHDFPGNSNVTRMLLGREPTTFEEFAKRELDKLS